MPTNINRYIDFQLFVFVLDLEIYIDLQLFILIFIRYITFQPHVLIFKKYVDFQMPTDVGRNNTIPFAGMFSNQIVVLQPHQIEKREEIFN